MVDWCPDEGANPISGAAGKLNSLRRIVWHATKGLLSFRSGYPQEGRLLYKKAIESADDGDLHSLRVQAAAALAAEEIEAGTIEGPLATRVAIDLAKRASGAVITTIIGRLAEKSGSARK